MNFCDAMELLKTGTKITRTVWKGSIYFAIKDEKVNSFQPRFMDYIYDEDIMVSTGWFVNDDQVEYDFCKIIPFLKDGKRAFMADWKDSYIYLDRSTNKLVVHVMEAFPFVPEFESFAATDWIEE